MDIVFWVLSGAFFMAGIYSWAIVAFGIVRPNVELALAAMYYLIVGIVFMTPFTYLVMKY